MNVALWILLVLLAGVYLLTAIMHLALPHDRLERMMGWVADVSPGTVKLVGIVELLGAIGLIAPIATGIAPILTPIAAIGLCLLQLVAGAMHARRKEWSQLPVNVVLLAAAAAAAWLAFASGTAATP